MLTTDLHRFTYSSHGKGQRVVPHRPCQRTRQPYCGPLWKKSMGATTPSCLKTRPSFMTNVTLRSASISSSGLAGTAMMSAAKPSRMGPRSSSNSLISYPLVVRIFRMSASGMPAALHACGGRVGQRLENPRWPYVELCCGTKPRQLPTLLNRGSSRRITYQPIRPQARTRIRIIHRRSRPTLLRMAAV